MAVPILTYFSFRGLGEPIRLMLHDLGVAFEDRRVSFGDEWAALKPQMLFRQMPRLQDGERTLFQSQAILRYLARPRGLCGEDEAERVRCDVSAEAARDLQQRLWDHFWSPGSDGPEAASAFEGGTLADQLALTATWLGEAPYFGGGRPLFADYYALSVLDEAAAFFPQAVEQAPVLAAYRQRMYARPPLAAYAASGRQPAGFGFDPIRGIRTPQGISPKG
jgi:glutathione S-transferase